MKSKVIGRGTHIVVIHYRLKKIMSDYELIVKLKTENPTIIITPELEVFLRPGALPSTVKTIILHNEFNKKIMPGSIPMGTETVEFGNKFDQVLDSDIFPSSVTCIKFGELFRQPLQQILKPNIKFLYLANSVYAHDLSMPSSIVEFHMAVTQLTPMIPKDVTDLYIFSAGNKKNYDFIISDNVKNVSISDGAYKTSTIFSLLKDNTDYVVATCDQRMFATDESRYSYRGALEYHINQIHNYHLSNNYILKIIKGDDLFFYTLSVKNSNAECNQLRKIIKQQQSENDVVVKNLNTENTQLKSIIADLQSENDIVVKNLNTENTQLKSIIANLELTQPIAQDTNTQVRLLYSIKNLDAENTKLQDTIAKLQMENTKLSNNSHFWEKIQAVLEKFDD